LRLGSPGFLKLTLGNFRRLPLLSSGEAGGAPPWDERDHGVCRAYDAAGCQRRAAGVHGPQGWGEPRKAAAASRREGGKVGRREGGKAGWFFLARIRRPAIFQPPFLLHLQPDRADRRPATMGGSEH
jgi:hypothetical protein